MAAAAPTTINGTRALAAAALRVSRAGRHGPNGEAVCGAGGVVDARGVRGHRGRKDAVAARLALMTKGRSKAPPFRCPRQRYIVRITGFMSALPWRCRGTQLRNSNTSPATRPHR
jgi:hypothetical protein